MDTHVDRIAAPTQVEDRHLSVQTVLPVLGVGPGPGPTGRAFDSKGSGCKNESSSGLDATTTVVSRCHLRRSSREGLALLICNRDSWYTWMRMMGGRSDLVTITMSVHVDKSWKVRGQNDQRMEGIC
jgi:hypothetical protein